MHNDLTRISLVIALTAGTIYHSAVLVALAAVLTYEAHVCCDVREAIWLYPSAPAQHMTEGSARRCR